MRDLHRADRRHRRALLRDSDQRLRRARDRDARGPWFARSSRSGAAGLHRRTGRAMRLLSQRHDHEHQGAVEPHPAPERSGGPRGPALQSVPMRRAYRDHARGVAGRGSLRRGARLMTAPELPDDAAVRSGSLSVVRPAVSGEKTLFETFIKITTDGSVTAFNGHVDLGTGIRTALGQIVAEELDVSFARVVVVLGDTSRVPNQGATIASETIQITAVPLRKAAAQARQFLLARAAEQLELPAEELTVEDGLIHGRDNRSISYGELIGDKVIRLELAGHVPLKAAQAYTIVGQSVPRIHPPAEAARQ